MNPTGWSMDYADLISHYNLTSTNNLTWATTTAELDQAIQHAEGMMHSINQLGTKI